MLSETDALQRPFRGRASWVLRSFTRLESRSSEWRLCALLGSGRYVSSRLWIDPEGSPAIPGDEKQLDAMGSLRHQAMLRLPVPSDMQRELPEGLAGVRQAILRVRVGRGVQAVHPGKLPRANIKNQESGMTEAVFAVT